ncbi:MAG: nitroreductase family protein [Candidatus Bathyarchaeota archaeon]|nr:nitroreductase family protein [Candidatus Bathyarchaeota archaeon]
MPAYRLIVLFLLLILFQFEVAITTPIETTISQRYSVRIFETQSVSSEQLLAVLQKSYGFVGSNRVLPKFGNDYSLVIYAVNASGSYRYTPETNSLAVHNPSVNKETIRSHVSNWPSDSSIVLVIVWDQNKMSNQYFASAEAGCLVQNVHLAAITENLGTTCVGSIYSAGLRGDLGLSSNMIPIIIMPLGYPTSPYSTATPNYNRMNGNLPVVQASSLSFTETLANINYSQAWTDQDLSLQEISQLLWAAYGYSSTGHRTTPSAMGIYPLIVYLANSTGTYRYLAESHSITQIQAGDRRSAIAEACGNQLWAAIAPAIFLVALDSSYNGGNIGDGGVLVHEWIEVDAGCVIQQILLEASAINMGANIVTNELEDWNGDGAQTLRSNLGLTSSIIPLYVMPVGHVSETPTPTPTPTPISTPTPTAMPTASPNSSPNSSPSSSPTATPTPSELPRPTPEKQYR